jgi:hypothetical protein
MTEDNGDPGDGEDRDGGTNFVPCLAPTGELETPARNDTPLQYPGKTFAVTGPWERGWL